MTDRAANPSPPPNDASAPASFRNWRQALAVLFFRPQFLLVLAQGHCLRALRLVAVLALLCGTTLATARLPQAMTTTREWITWFGSIVSELTLEDGRLSWAQPADLPYTAHRRQWRIDFAADDVEFDPHERRGPHRQGLWVSADEAYMWRRSGENEQAHATVVFRDNKLFGLVDTSVFWPDGFSLTGPEMTATVMHNLWRAVPFLVVFEAVGVLLQVLFYTFIFAFIPYILKSPLAAGGFKHVFAFYLYASIPPMITATVYAALGLALMDFNTFFVLGFIAYLVLVIWRTGRAFQVA
jgi:hypothetical protein